MTREGSATTAEAVFDYSMDLNCSFILVQLPENIDDLLTKATSSEKDKWNNIVEMLDKNNRPHTLDYIGFERIVRAAKRIKEKNLGTTADLGFKHYILKEPKGLTLDKLEEFIPDDHGLFLNNDILSDFGLNTVLTTWLIRDGYGFNADVKEIDFEGYTGYYIDKHLYLISPDISKEAIAAIVDKYEVDGNFNAENVVLFGYSFVWTMLEELKINLARLKDTEKNLRINFDVRY